MIWQVAIGIVLGVILLMWLPLAFSLLAWAVVFVLAYWERIFGIIIIIIGAFFGVWNVRSIIEGIRDDPIGTLVGVLFFAGLGFFFWMVWRGWLRLAEKETQRYD
jgi:hypothetical protein